MACECFTADPKTTSSLSLGRDVGGGFIFHHQHERTKIIQLISHVSGLNGINWWTGTSAVSARHCTISHVS